MTEIRSKSSDIIRAQIAAFAAETVEGGMDHSHILDDIDRLAVEEPGEVSRAIGRGEFRKDENGEAHWMGGNTKRVVATPVDYVDFLRSVGGVSYESIQGRSDILRAYSAFAPAIGQLKDELSGFSNPKEHPAFLGYGSNSKVFSINDSGKDFAVRIPDTQTIRARVIDGHLGAAVLGRGVPHLEQIVAASYENGVTVAEIMPGQEIGDMTINDIRRITDSQLGELVDTLITAHQRGVEIDPKPSNIFYDPEIGYGFVDCRSSKLASKYSQDQELGEIVGWMAAAINGMGLGGAYDADRTADDYADDLVFYQANLEVLKRYRAIVASKLEFTDAEVALEEVDWTITSLLVNNKSYSDPAWVAGSIAREKEMKRRRVELDGERKPALER